MCRVLGDVRWRQAGPPQRCVSHGITVRAAGKNGLTQEDGKGEWGVRTDHWGALILKELVIES